MPNNIRNTPSPSYTSGASSTSSSSSASSASSGASSGGNSASTLGKRQWQPQTVDPRAMLASAGQGHFHQSETQHWGTQATTAPVQNSGNYAGSYAGQRHEVGANPHMTGQTHQVDHFPPTSTYAGTDAGSKSSYGSRPAFPLAKELHQPRGGEHGMGGVASSTGSGAVAQAWNGGLQNLMQRGEYASAMAKDIIDKQNIAFQAHGDRHAFDAELARGVQFALDQGLLNDDQAAAIFFERFDPNNKIY